MYRNWVKAELMSPLNLVFADVEPTREALLCDDLLDDLLDLPLGRLDAPLARPLDQQEQLPLTWWHGLVRGVILPLDGNRRAGKLGNLSQCVLVRHLPARLLREVVNLELRLEVRPVRLEHAAPGRRVLRVQRGGKRGGSRGSGGGSGDQRHAIRRLRDGEGHLRVVCRVDLRLRRALGRRGGDAERAPNLGGGRTSGGVE
mmetsp:Transcript_14650/g.59792  ORF Transcript_14650/g.59792 Transcript_14650/m.59792 type:complete len:201 (-) Transcript_14650:5382-5984(-)